MSDHDEYYGDDTEHLHNMGLIQQEESDKIIKLLSEAVDSAGEWIAGAKVSVEPGWAGSTAHILGKLTEASQAVKNYRGTPDNDSPPQSHQKDLLHIHSLFADDKLLRWTIQGDHIEHVWETVKGKIITEKFYPEKVGQKLKTQIAAWREKYPDEETPF